MYKVVTFLQVVQQKCIEKLAGFFTMKMLQPENIHPCQTSQIWLMVKLRLEVKCLDIQFIALKLCYIETIQRNHVTDAWFLNHHNKMKISTCDSPTILPSLIEVIIILNFNSTLFKKIYVYHQCIYFLVQFRLALNLIKILSNYYYNYIRQLCYLYHIEHGISVGCGGSLLRAVCSGYLLLVLLHEHLRVSEAVRKGGLRGHVYQGEQIQHGSVPHAESLPLRGNNSPWHTPEQEKDHTFKRRHPS